MYNETIDVEVQVFTQMNIGSLRVDRDKQTVVVLVFPIWVYLLI